jgi:hypothetical protein
MSKILIAADDLMIAGMAGQFLSACRRHGGAADVRRDGMANRLPDRNGAGGRLA